MIDEIRWFQPVDESETVRVDVGRAARGPRGVLHGQQIVLHRWLFDDTAKGYSSRGWVLKNDNIEGRELAKFPIPC